LDISLPPSPQQAELANSQGQLKPHTLGPREGKTLENVKAAPEPLRRIGQSQMIHTRHKDLQKTGAERQVSLQGEEPDRWLITDLAQPDLVEPLSSPEAQSQGLISKRNEISETVKTAKSDPDSGYESLSAPPTPYQEDDTVVTRTAMAQGAGVEQSTKKPDLERPGTSAAEQAGTDITRRKDEKIVS
jgi:hypothetical protein